MVTVLSSRFYARLFPSLIKNSFLLVLHFLWSFWYYSDGEQSESPRSLSIIIPASQFVINQSLSLSKSLHLLLSLLLLGHCCSLFYSVRLLCLSLEDIALSLVEKRGRHQDLIADLPDLPHHIVILYYRIVTYQRATIITYSFQLPAVITSSFKRARVPVPKPRSPNHPISYSLHCIIDRFW